MIEFIYANHIICQACNARFEYDTRLVKRKPRTCADCKKKRMKAAGQRVKQQTHAVDTQALERNALRTHQEVGAIMGISPEAVRKIELRALSKLRSALAPWKDEL